MRAGPGETAVRPHKNMRVVARFSTTFRANPVEKPKTRHTPTTLGYPHGWKTQTLTTRNCGGYLNLPLYVVVRSPRVL